MVLGLAIGGEQRGVLALEVAAGEAPEGAYVKDWSINGVDATLSVRRA